MKLKTVIKKITPHFLLDFYYWLWVFLGAFASGFAGKSGGMKIIGITGTSGKSTTNDFVTRILEEAPSAGSGQAKNKVASISTIRFKVGEKEWENKYKMTMPGRFVIQKFLKQAKQAGCNFVVLEVTSEGIKQFRHKFINFDVAVFTNLTPEHIESHGGFENYRKEKLKLFKATKNIHIINGDDKNSKYFLDVPAAKKISFSLNDAKNISTDGGLKFDFKGTQFNLNLLGEFNIYNALAAICVAQHYGISLDVCKKAFEKTKAIPGRMEIVNKNPLVVVDYAHTPAQLEEVYKSFGKKSLVCVLGSCGGGRDKWKRPVLGKLAQQYCKEIIITNEDPYDEDPLEIMEQVANGAEGHDHHIVIDRKEAIKKAVELAEPNDAVVITGKGCEPWMCVADGKKNPWDDRQIARDELAKLKP